MTSQQTKYKIGVGINYWDDPKGLLEILEYKKFYDYVDTIFVIDGRYKGRVDEEQYDKTLGQKICSSYDKVHYVRMYDVKQIEKRNKYWELAEQKGMDFMIVLDSDETCTFSETIWDSLEICDKYDSRMFPISQDHVDVVAMDRPRLFKKPFDYRHRQNTGPNISHGQLWSDYGLGNQEIIKGMYKFKEDKTTPKNVPGILLTHDKKWRTPERVDADYTYYKNNPTR